jgi:lysyl-tRNA synthetase class 2
MTHPTPTIDINDERSVRLGKLHDLEAEGIKGFPAQAPRTHSLKDALALTSGEQATIAGRILVKRDIGKIAFVQLFDGSGVNLQAVFKKDTLGEESYKRLVKKIDAGDIISVVGERFTTNAGEESLLASSWTLLTKSLLPLPDKFHGLQDEETRLRKRYLDILTHPELKALFVRKSMFWQSIREFLLREGFLEVETPVLENTPGGADATPFVTHHNSLDIDVYLRISMGELWQKRLMVAGFEKTFEIGRQFRNEGMSREHLQDYTQMEFYWAYADYAMSMALVERMYKEVIQKTFGTSTFTIGEFTDIDISKPWEKIDYTETIQKMTGVDISDPTADFRGALEKLGVRYEAADGTGRLIDLLWKYCRKQIKGPVFLVNHPVSVSPLAKSHADKPELTERYQVIIAGSELGNGYSELNDPVEQKRRFEEQARLREEGDTEAQMHDKEFVEALEHGMPPTSGFGVSERLFSFLENRPIRDCVLFPLIRPPEQTESL